MKTKRKANQHLKSKVVIPRTSRSYVGERPIELIQRNILPDGDIIGWKVCKSKPGREGRDLLVKLLIPADARRINPLGERKCRAEYAKVLWVEGGGKAYAWLPCTGKPFIYMAGKTVRPTNGFDASQEDCGAGINFFIHKAEARYFAKHYF